MARFSIVSPFPKTYLEVDVPSLNNSNGNIICCVDTSGSMAGAPIDNVKAVLSDVYENTQVDYPVYQYHTSVIKTSVSRASGLVASGGTAFACVFDEIAKTIRSAKTPTASTWIFMTDGEDMSANPNNLRLSMEKLKLAARACSEPVTIHVIGFGSVKEDFLDSVRRLGNREGLFRYANQSTELQNSFNDMFEYAAAQQYTITIGSKTYVGCSNDGTLSLLLDEVFDEPILELSISTQDKQWQQVLTAQLLSQLNGLQHIKALNLLPVEDEPQVRELLTAVRQMSTDSSLSFYQKMEVDQIRKEIEARMLEYIALFTEIKMSQVPEKVKLKLNALRHDATFSNLQRKKALDLRVSKNVDYFKKTDIPGILNGFRAEMTPEAWQEIRSIKDEWVDIYSGCDLEEVMRRSSDNILCLGILVRRCEQSKESPDAKLILESVSNTIISYDSFLEAMRRAKANAPAADNSNGNNGNGDSSYGQFEGINETYCLVGTGDEKINAVIPLYIHKEHFKRVRILEGLWLGHLYTLDSYGYDKSQEVALLKLLADMIKLDTHTSRYRQLVTEFEKVCQFIINESLGFQSFYGSTTFDSFINNTFCRSHCDSTVPLITGYLKAKESGDINIFNKTVQAVLLQDIRQAIKSANSPYRKGQAPLDLCRSLLYGNEERTVSVVERPALSSNHDPDYVEKSYIKYFRDETSLPIPVVAETSSVDSRLPIIPADDDVIALPLKDPYLSQHLSFDLPNQLFALLGTLTSNPAEEVLRTDPSVVRQALLMALAFDDVPPHVQLSGVCDIVDRKLQGDVDISVKFDENPENIKTITYVACNAKTVEGFAGVLKKYCARRCGKVIDAIVRELMTQRDASSVEKLTALLRNRVGHQVFFRNDELCFCPLVAVAELREVIGDLHTIEQENRQANRRVVHRYRSSNKPNRHKYSNHNPNFNLTYPFQSYS